MPASDVPGLVLSYRFNAANFVNDEFVELSGFGENMKTLSSSVGPPNFVTKNGSECLLLDNQWHGAFFHPNSWQGTCLAFCHVTNITTTTQVRYPIIYASNGASGNAKRMSFTYFSGGTTLITTAMHAKSTPAQLLYSTGHMVMMSMDQENRVRKSSLNGTNVSATTPDASSINGLNNALGSNPDGAILGATRGSTSNTSAEVNLNMHIYELHYYDSFPMDNHQTELAAFRAEVFAEHNS